MPSEQKHNISFIPFFFFITYKILTCERTLISALQALRKHHRICNTTPIKLRFTSDGAPPHTHHHSDSMGILCNVPASDVQRHPHPYLPHSSNIHHRHHKHCIHSCHNLPLYLFLSNPQSDFYRQLPFCLSYAILLLFKKQYDSKEIYYVPEYSKRPGDAFKFCQHTAARLFHNS